MSPRNRTLFLIVRPSNNKTAKVKKGKKRNKMHSTTSESTAPPEKSTLQASSSTSHSNSPAIATTKSPSTSLLTTTSKGKNSTPLAKKVRPSSPPILLLTTKESSSELLNIDNMPVPKIGTTLQEEKKNLLHPTIPESQASPAKKTRPNSPPILLLTTKESSSELLNIDNMPVLKIGTTLKEAKKNFLHPTIPASQALLTLKNTCSSIPTIPPMPKTIDLPLIAPDKTSVKKRGKGTMHHSWNVQLMCAVHATAKVLLHGLNTQIQAISTNSNNILV